MLERISPPNKSASLPLQFQSDQAALSLNANSARRARLVWTGLGFAVLMLLEVLVCAYLPSPSHDSGTPSILFGELAAVVNEDSEFQYAAAWSPTMPLGLGACTYRTVPLKAGRVISAWWSLADAEAEESLRDESTYNAKTHLHMVHVQLLLGAMKKRITGFSKLTSRPDHMFGYAFGDASPDCIEALAFVEFIRTRDCNGKLSDLTRQYSLFVPWWGAWRRGVDSVDGWVEVVYIAEIAAKPGTQKGVGAELIRGIIDWAMLKGKLVTLVPANGLLVEYYRGLGFELIDEEAQRKFMVYSGDRKAEIERHQMSKSSDGRTRHAMLLDMEQ